jgi:hypothetical protein
MKLNKEQNLEVSDTTQADNYSTVGKQKSITLLPERKL